MGVFENPMFAKGTFAHRPCRCRIEGIFDRRWRRLCCRGCAIRDGIQDHTHLNRWWRIAGVFVRAEASGCGSVDRERLMNSDDDDPIIAGNWKMFKTISETQAFFDCVSCRLISGDVTIATSSSLRPLRRWPRQSMAADGTRVAISAQDVYWEEGRCLHRRSL